MIANAWRRWMRLWRAELLSPRWMTLWAVRLTAVAGMAHLLGWRDYTAVLSGTFATDDLVVSGFLGFFYLVAWFGFVLGAPSLLLGAAAAWALERALRRAAARPSNRSSVAQRQGGSSLSAGEGAP